MFVPNAQQGGDHIIRCLVVGILSLLKDDTDGTRALDDKYRGLHTLQYRPIYSIKMWYLISYAPGCAYLEEIQI